MRVLWIRGPHVFFCLDWRVLLMCYLSLLLHQWASFAINSCFALLLATKTLSSSTKLLYISMWNAVNEVFQVKGLLASGKNRYIHEEQKEVLSQPMALDAIMLWLLGDAIWSPAYTGMVKKGEGGLGQRAANSSSARIQRERFLGLSKFLTWFYFTLPTCNLLAWR